MNCSNHPATEAVDICPACHKPVCSQCLINISGRNYCRTCLEQRIGSWQGHSGSKSRLLAFLLSLVPGGGYFYLGLMKRGLQTIILFFGTIFFSSIIRLEALTAFVLPVLVFYSVFDTQQLLKKMAEGTVEDRELFDWGSWESKRSLLGAALIILGIFALLNNMLPYLINYHLIGRILPPILILGLGVYILYKNTAAKGVSQDGNNNPEG